MIPRRKLVSIEHYSRSYVEADQVSYAWQKHRVDDSKNCCPVRYVRAIVNPPSRSDWRFPQTIVKVSEKKFLTNIFKIDLQEECFILF